MPDLTTKDALLERMVEETEDLATNLPAKFDEYLPLTGGTVTGPIKGNPLTLTADDGEGNSVDLVLGSDGVATWNSNNLLTDKIETAEISNAPIGPDKIYFTKCGRICMVTFGYANNIPAGSTNITAEIPAGFRPYVPCRTMHTTASNRQLFIQAENDKISFYNYSSAITTTTALYETLVYITS